MSWKVNRRVHCIEEILEVTDGIFEIQWQFSYLELSEIQRIEMMDILAISRHENLRNNEEIINF